MSWNDLVTSDSDGDGKLSRTEFRGPDFMWDRLDSDGDGFITETEHSNVRRGGRPGVGDERRPRSDDEGEEDVEPEIDVFKALDADGNGRVTKGELTRVLREADEDRSRWLSREELESWLEENGAVGLASAVEGKPAPEFELARLDVRRKRAGETETLASLRGKPVFLMFGSYT